MIAEFSIEMISIDEAKCYSFFFFFNFIEKKTSLNNNTIRISSHDRSQKSKLIIIIYQFCRRGHPEVRPQLSLTTQCDKRISYCFEFPTVFPAFFYVWPTGKLHKIIILESEHKKKNIKRKRRRAFRLTRNIWDNKKDDAID